MLRIPADIDETGLSLSTKQERDMNNQIHELSSRDLDHVSGGLRNLSIDPTPAPSGPIVMPFPGGHGPVILPNPISPPSLNGPSVFGR
jgi:hypothetical protein